LYSRAVAELWTVHISVGGRGDTPFFPFFFKTKFGFRGVSVLLETWLKGWSTAKVTGLRNKEGFFAKDRVFLLRPLKKKVGRP
jgi:hypothetical protein